MSLFADDKAPDVSKMSYEELENNGVDYLLAQKFDLAQKCFDEMLKRETSKKNPDTAELTIIYYMLGRTFQDNKDFPNAVKYFNKALDGEKTLKDTLLKSQLYFFAGTAFYKSNDLGNAEKLASKAYTLISNAYGKQNIRMVSCLALMASISEQKHDYDKAVKFFKDAIDILENTNGNINALQRVKEKLSACLKKQQENQ